ncbi:MAG: SpoIID/LytB domain-containing protein [Ilumatobacteraceae bacterium]
MLRDARRILSIAVCLAVAPMLGVFPASDAAADTVDGQFDKTGALVGGVVLDLTVGGRGGVPTTGVASVALNVTAINASANGFLTVWPAGQARPLSSNLNFIPGRVVPNMVVVPLGTGGKISLWSPVNVDVVVDVLGWFPTGSFNGLTPARLMDTRGSGVTVDGTFAGGPKLAAATTLSLTIAGRGGVPLTGVAAVALNVTAINPSANGFLTVWPAGQARPLSSNLNFSPGQTVPNMVIVPLGADGISLWSPVNVDVVVDVLGWFPTGSFNGLTPARLMDTRGSGVTVDGTFAGGPKLAAATTLSLTVAGRGGVPSTGVAAVALNVTAINPSANGFMTVWPAGQARPLSSNLNFSPGRVVPNMVIVPLGADGKISLWSPVNLDVVVDVLGWFPTGSFNGLTPARLMDTRVPPTPASLVLDGHGSGHGYGLSQWGAYGYAVDYGWSSAQILNHYYGGTVSGTVPLDTTIAVRLQNLDNLQTAVVNANGLLIVDGVAGGPWRSVLAREVSPSVYSVWARTDAQVCPATTGDPVASGWTLVAASVATRVNIRSQASVATTAYSDLIAVCEPSGKVRSYRGLIRAINGTEGENRTVNELPIEHYLRAVIAKEMSPSWANAGGGRGAQALQAQAVAARSYGLAENRYSYAKTCDLVCQFYQGAAYRNSVGGSYIAVEYPSTDAAVAATAGVVRRVGNTSGPIAYTMFAASTGGWTRPGVGSLMPFASVQDLGDATPGNPSHNWTVTLTGAAISAKYPSIGTFLSITVLTRNGIGEWGGWVSSLRVTGTAGSVTVTGDSFRTAFGLKSAWFNPR